MKISPRLQPVYVQLADVGKPRCLMDDWAACLRGVMLLDWKYRHP